MELQVVTELLSSKPKWRYRIARRLRNAYRYDTAFWRSAVAGPWGAGMFAFGLLALGMPTGLGTAVDLLLFLLAGTLGLYLTAHTAALLLALIGVPIPRLFTGAVLFDFAAVFVIFNYNEVSAAASAVVAGGISLAGIAAGLLFCREIKKGATVAISGEAADEVFGGYPKPPLRPCPAWPTS